MIRSVTGRAVLRLLMACGSLWLAFVPVAGAAEGCSRTNVWDLSVGPIEDEAEPRLTQRPGTGNLIMAADTAAGRWRPYVITANHVSNVPGNPRLFITLRDRGGRTNRLELRDRVVGDDDIALWTLPSGDYREFYFRGFSRTNVGDRMIHMPFLPPNLGFPRGQMFLADGGVTVQNSGPPRFLVTLRFQEDQNEWTGYGASGSGLLQEDRITGVIVMLVGAKLGPCGGGNEGVFATLRTNFVAQLGRADRVEGGFGFVYSGR